MRAIPVSITATTTPFPVDLSQAARSVDAADGFEVMPLLVVARIVGRQRPAQDAIGFGVFDVRIAGDDIARQLLGFGERQPAIHFQHLRTQRGGAHAVHGDTEACRGQLACRAICESCAAAVAAAEELRYLTMIRSVKPASAAIAATGAHNMSPITILLDRRVINLP